MANKTITVLEADGVTETDIVSLDVGRQAAAASKSVGLSTEDKAVLDSLATKLDTAITALQIIDNMVLAAGTANIGDVDVASIAAGANLIGKVDIQLAGTVPDTGAGTGGAKTLRFIPDSAYFSALGQSTKSAATNVTMASDQGYAGNTGGITALFDVTLSLDTSIYASGDVLADTQVLTSLFRITDGTGVLQSIQVIDQDDQKAAFDIYYLSANVTMGTENSAPSISDANAVNVVGPFSVAVADYKDLGGASVAKISNIGQPITAVSGTANGYIAVVNGTGTPTYTASGIKLRLGVLKD